MGFLSGYIEKFKTKKPKGVESHFFYSDIQKENQHLSGEYHTTYALIDGEVVEYTECKMWILNHHYPDSVYLGTGVFHHYEN